MVLFEVAHSYVHAKSQEDSPNKSPSGKNTTSYSAFSFPAFLRVCQLCDKHCATRPFKKQPRASLLFWKPKYVGENHLNVFYRSNP